MEPNELHFEIARQVIAFRDKVGASSEWQSASGIIIWVKLAPNRDDVEEIDFNIFVRSAHSLFRRNTSEVQSVNLVAALIATLYFNGDDIPGLLFENKGFVPRRLRKAQRRESEEEDEPPSRPPNTDFSGN